MKKSLTLPVAIGVAILGCVLAVSANVSSMDMRRTLEKERYGRLDAERLLQDAMQKNSALESELGTARSKIQGIESIISQGQNTTDSLKSQLDTVVQENETLKASLSKLQEELAARAGKAVEAAVEAIPVPTMMGTKP